jgi:hypothetical protein
MKPLDLRALFGVLAENAVEYVVIGGVAAQVHGHRRTTKDLDVIPDPDRGNLERLASTLTALEARPPALGPDAPSPTADQLAVTAIVPPLSTIHGELHICNDVPGAAPYGDLRRRALATDLDGIPVRIVSLDDLISMKRAFGRPRDLEDITVLNAVARAEAPPPIE